MIFPSETAAQPESKLSGNPLLSQEMELSAARLPPLKKRRIVSINRGDLRANDQGRSSPTGLGAITPSPPSSPTSNRKSVTWNDKKGNIVLSEHVSIPSASSCTSDSELWYTRENYNDFLMDRLKTIQSHRSRNTNNKNHQSENSNIDSNNFCIRGLELYQDNNSNQLYHSKKKLYHSTVIMEQARQGILGINEPERFRSLVAPQSDLALYRAQELAAQDEREVYSYQSKERLRLMHNMMNMHSTNPNAELERNVSSSSTIVSCGSSVNSSGTATSTDSAESDNSGTSLFTDSIRRLQEKNARRLMGIYQQNGETGGDVREDNINKLFRFARRDSLLGIGNNGKGTVGTTLSTNASIDNNNPTTQDMMAMMMHRRRMFLKIQQQQWSLLNKETDLAGKGESNFSSTRKRQLEEYLSQKHQQRQQTLQAMSGGDSRFPVPIRRDTLTNYHANTEPNY